MMCLIPLASAAPRPLCDPCGLAASFYHARFSQMQRGSAQGTPFADFENVSGRLYDHARTPRVGQRVGNLLVTGHECVTDGTAWTACRDVMAET